MKLTDRSPKKSSFSFRLAIGFLGLFSLWLCLAWWAAERLIVRKTVERADAILVLGGSSVYLERTRKAAELFSKGAAPKILLTDDGGRAGWARDERRNTPFAELAKKELIAQGVPAESIEILQPPVTGTIYEAQNLRRKIEETNWQSVLLVTSAYHTRRALGTFESVLAERGTKIGIDSPPPGEQTPPTFIWWLSPFGWNVVAGEYVKSAYYWAYY